MVTPVENPDKNIFNPFAKGTNSEVIIIRDDNNTSGDFGTQ